MAHVKLFLTNSYCKYRERKITRELVGTCAFNFHTLFLVILLETHRIALLECDMNEN